MASSVDAFRRLLRSLRLAARLTEASAGLSAAQLYVLTAVAETEPASLKDLAARTMTDRSSVASVIERLAERGLICRGQAAADRRRAAVTLTPAGRRALQGAPLPPTEILVAGLRALSDARLRELASGLTELTRAMGIDVEPAGMLFEDPPKRRSAPRRTGNVA